MKKRKWTGAKGVKNPFGGIAFGVLFTLLGIMYIVVYGLSEGAIIGFGFIALGLIAILYYAIAFKRKGHKNTPQKIAVMTLTILLMLSMMPVMPQRVQASQTSWTSVKKRKSTVIVFCAMFAVFMISTFGVGTAKARLVYLL